MVYVGEYDGAHLRLEYKGNNILVAGACLVNRGSIQKNSLEDRSSLVAKANKLKANAVGIRSVSEGLTQYSFFLVEETVLEELHARKFANS